MKNLIVVLLLAAVTISGFGCRREKITYEGKVVASTIYEAETDLNIWKLSDFPLEIIDTLKCVVSEDKIESDTALVSKLLGLGIETIFFPGKYCDSLIRINQITINPLNKKLNKRELLFWQEDKEFKIPYGYIITYRQTKI